MNTASKNYALKQKLSLESKEIQSLAKLGRAKIHRAESDMVGLMALRKEYKESQPLKGANIAGCIHMTIETAVLIETLIELGANVRWASSNPLSTQDEAAAALAVRGIPIFAWKGMTHEEYEWAISQTVEFETSVINMILDDGGDLTKWIHEKKTLLLKHIRGISEETTTGVRQLKQMHHRGKLRVPSIDVNGSVIKTKFDNFYGSKESVIDGIKRSIDFMIAGKLILIAGYGDVGRGCAQGLQGFGGRIIIAEADPIRAYQAAMDGFEVKAIDSVAPLVDLFITATGCNKVITKIHFEKMKNNAIVSNMGHFDVEVDIKYLENSSDWKKEAHSELVDIYENQTTKKRIVVLAQGRLLNLCAGKGHPAFVMSNSFSLQVLAQIELWKNFENYSIGVYPIPHWMEEKVALLHLEKLGVELNKLTKEQCEYITIPEEL